MPMKDEEDERGFASVNVLKEFFSLLHVNK